MKNIEELRSLIQSESWEKAGEYLQNYKENHTYTDELACCEISILTHFNTTDVSSILECIEKGLAYNYRNYELYFALGNYYTGRNNNQAYLCYENAEYYCNNEDRELITQFKNVLGESGMITVKPVSIVILSYNCAEMMKHLIQSIEEHNARETYEIVVVDNASNDGITHWLMKQDRIRLRCNVENVGFPKGCNQGIEMSERNNDIFLLNNDTVIMPNSIFWLRMGLYEEESVGAVGSCSNCVSNWQQIPDIYESLQEYQKFAEKNNVFVSNPYEKKIWLVGFALMIKRAVLEQVGYLDEIYSPGNFEDNDMGMKITSAGYQCMLCWNSFIYHYGSQGFGKNNEKYMQLIKNNYAKFRRKWKVDTMAREENGQTIVDLIKKDKNDNFRVLELGCGCGTTLARLQWLFPNVEVIGIEKDEKIVQIACNILDIRLAAYENISQIFSEKYFDYIIMQDEFCKIADIEKLFVHLRTILKDSGSILIKAYNMQHYSVIGAILNGTIDAEGEGPLNKKYCRQYTAQSCAELLYQHGFMVQDARYFRDDGIDADSKYAKDRMLVEKFSKVVGERNTQLMDVYQFSMSFQKNPAYFN